MPGIYKGPAVHITLKEELSPIFRRHRPVAFALLDKVEKAIDELVRENILEPILQSEWATPVVPVLKKNGKLRLCAL